MIEIYFASLLAGIILGAPVGVTGAMVADAALAHCTKRLFLTVVAVALGDAVLALLSTLFSDSMKGYLEHYRKVALCAGGMIMVLAGVYIIAVTAITHRGMNPKDKPVNPSSKWIIAHVAPTIAAFLTSIIHPGNIAAFLALMTIFSLKFPDFLDYKTVFVSGIFTGSLLIFSAAGFLFWKIRQKADRFVHFLRYTLAVIITLSGVYLTLEIFNI